jgi:hypothetical protein
MLVKKEINLKSKCGLNSKSINDKMLSVNLFKKRNFNLLIKQKYSFCNDIADEDIQYEIIKDEKFLNFIDINKDKILGYFYISSNLTINCSYKKIAKVVNFLKDIKIDKDFNIALIDVVKDLEKLNMDENQEFRLSYYDKEFIDRRYEGYIEQQKKEKKNNDK